MTTELLRNRSLKSRIALVTLGVFLLSVWSVVFYVGHTMRSEMENHLGEQQFATVSILAGEINTALSDRLAALETIAATITPVMLADPAALQSKLDRHLIFQSLFNGGTRVMLADGSVAASVPRSSERLNANYADRDYLQRVLRDGQPAIGRPVIGKVLKAPVLGMAVPIRHAGKVIGAVVGAINLSEANFLDAIAKGRYGLTGGYLLFAPEHGLIVAATDKTRVLQPMPSPGANPMFDRYLGGFEGYGVAVSSRQVEELSAARRIPAAGWFIVGVLPTAEAFAPIRDTLSRLFYVTIALSLVAGAIAWWATAHILRRQLAPMLATTHLLEGISGDYPIPPHLAITNDDEIGQLINGFNHLLDVLALREAGIRASEQKLATILDSVDAYIYLKDAEGRYLFANRRVRNLFALEDSDIIGHGDEKFFDQDTARKLRANDREVLDQGLTLRTEETNHNIADGQTSTYLSVKLPLRDESGKIYALCGISTDISEHKRIELALRESEDLYRTAFLTSPDAVNITRIQDGLYLQVNDGFLHMTGWTREQVIGHTTHELDIWTDRADRQRMVDLLRQYGFFENLEAKFRSATGRLITGLMSAHTITWQGEPCILSVTRDITARKQIEEQVTHLAFYDTLTTLPNRRLMLDRLNQAMTSCVRHNRRGALMLLDLDNFKSLNDTLGHDVGDQLLVEVAKRMEASVRRGDTVARLGGDEFVVILEDLDSDENSATQAEAVAAKIQKALSLPYRLKVTAVGDELSERMHHCTSSLGITLFKDESVTGDELLRRADTAMYQSKQAGRNTLRFFDPKMQADIFARAAMENDLRKAIFEREFILYYQAQLHSSGSVIGAEALVRWRHAERGLVSPGAFIPLAESTGLILPLGHWVLETACRQLAAWAGSPDTAGLTLAVNISARQFSLPSLVEEVMALIDYYGTPPNKLKLELTESLLFENADEVIAKMSALKARGVGFSLDDFGTGYSSLSYLKRLPLDQLKIDQSFVRDVLSDASDATIARTIVALAHSLGLSVIAEGVESEGQREFLQRHECHAFQGYLFGRPVPVDEFEALVARTLSA